MDRRNFLRLFGLAGAGLLAPIKTYSFLGGILRPPPLMDFTLWPGETLVSPSPTDRLDVTKLIDCREDRVVLYGVRSPFVRSLRVASDRDPIRKGEYRVVSRDLEKNSTTIYSSSPVAHAVFDPTTIKPIMVDGTLSFSDPVAVQMWTPQG